MKKITLKALIIMIPLSFLLISINFDSNADLSIGPNNGGKLPPLPSPIVAVSRF